MKRFLAIAVAVLLTVTQLAGAGGTVKAAEENKNGFTETAQNGELTLFVNKSNGEIALYNASNGVWWYSNPQFEENDGRIANGQRRLMSAQLEILYYDTKNSPQERNSAVASVAKGGLAYEKTANGARFTYDFPEDEITLTVEYELKDGCLKVSVPKDKIRENGDNRLLEVSVLPYFGCGGYDDSGYMILPDGSGSMIEMNNGKSAGAAIHERVYGADAVAAEERVTAQKKNMQLPVIGINKNGSGIIAVVSAGDGSSYINAYTAGMKKNYNCAYFSFEYRSTGTVILDSSSKNAKTVRKISDEPISTDFEMRYYPLSGAGDYSEMAAAYRGYLEKEKNFKADKMTADMPFYTSVYGALRKEGTVCFIPMTVTVPLTAYSQARSIMSELKKAGIKEQVFSYVGWEKDGSYGKMPTAGKYEGKLGGKKEFLKLADYADENGIKLLPEVNTVRLMKTGNGFSKSNAAAATLDGTPGLQYSYSLSSGLKNTKLNPYYLLMPKRFSEVLKKYYKKYDTDLLAGISLRQLGNVLYSDHHKNSVDRDMSIGYITKALETAADKSESILTESAFEYAALYSDYIISAPTSDSGYDITDRSVPFYQLVMSGFRSYSEEPVNLSSDTGKALLKAIETGGALNYTFTAENSAKTEGTYLADIYNSDYKDWAELAAEQYKALNAVYKQTGGMVLSSHKQLAEGVYLSCYKGGSSAIVNYTNSDYIADGITVKSESFVILS